MTAKMYRQGDLLFTAIPELPEGPPGAQTRSLGGGKRLIIAIACGHRQGVEETQGRLFLEARRATQVVPQEHHPIHLPEGFSRVIRQREYTPLAIREVYN
jgi:hypothetical protein